MGSIWKYLAAIFLIGVIVAELLKDSEESNKDSSKKGEKK